MYSSSSFGALSDWRLAIISKIWLQFGITRASNVGFDAYIRFVVFRTISIIINWTILYLWLHQAFLEWRVEILELNTELSGVTLNA